MKKNLPRHQYTSEELERTQRNIGPITRKDAVDFLAKMHRQSSRGATNRGSSHVNRRTQSEGIAIRDTRSGNQSKPNIESKTKGATSTEHPASIGDADRSTASLTNRERKPPTTRKLGRLDQVRANLIACRGEHRIISIWTAIYSIITLQSNGNERLSTTFIEWLSSSLLPQISSVQRGAERLLKGGRRRRDTSSRPDPTYHKIIETLSSWEVDKIGIELQRLRSHPKPTLNHSLSLCVLLYRPFIILWDSFDTAVDSAVYHYNKYVILNVGDDHNLIQDARKGAIAILENIGTMVRMLLYDCYPLLLKLIGSPPMESRMFFIQQKEDYLQLLDLRREELIVLPTPLPPIQPSPSGSAVVPESIDGKTREEVVQAGITLLAELFPSSKVEQLEDLPDLLPYFDAVFHLDRYFVLISPKDPLHAIVIVMEVVRELLYSFSRLSLGELQNRKWSLENLFSVLNDYCDQWFHYLDSVIPNKIIDPLLNYCREIDKFDAVESTYAAMLRESIQRTKKLLFLPFAHYSAIGSSSANQESGDVNLLQLTEDFSELLRSICGELETGNRECVLNADAPIVFNTDSVATKRMAIVIERRGVQKTNETLIKFTEVLVSMLWVLIGTPSGPFYKSPPNTLYRVSEYSDLRVGYSVVPVNTQKILAEDESQP